VLAVVYLIFNEGYGGRVDLAAEALRLGAALTELMPDEPEVHGLHALMLLNDARRAARFDEGELVLLADQDRSRWDAAAISHGRAALDRSLALRGAGPYVVQAAIASLHLHEPHDWPQIAALYGELARLTGSPIVELNRAIAVAEAQGAAAGLALVDRLGLDSYQYFHSTRADLLRRLGRAGEARSEYEHALELAHTEHERPLPATAHRGSQRAAVPSGVPVRRRVMIGDKRRRRRLLQLLAAPQGPASAGRTAPANAGASAPEVLGELRLAPSCGELRG